MNQKIDEDGGEEELRRAAMELTIPGNEAGMGKVATENAVSGSRHGMSIPKERRMP